MQQNSGGLTCVAGCWLVALLGGVLVAALLMLLAGFGFLAAAFFGILALLIGGAILTWAFCRALPGPNEAVIAQPDIAADSAAKTQPAPAPAASAPEPAAAAPAPAAAVAASAAAAAPSVKTGTILPGEEDLSTRKGSWKYEGKGAPAPKPAPPKPSAPAASGNADYDGDGKQEGAGEGTRPEALSGPRDGKADDLKQIKGIGPKLEKLCNSLGFYHFDQIANWTPDEVAWVNANLEGFKGRVTRDTWVDQAKVLATGGETEFSKRVEDGDVY